MAAQHAKPKGATIMADVPRKTATCTCCGRTFDKVTLDPNFASYLKPIDRRMRVDQPAAICSDCYKLFMDWLDRKPTN